MFSPKQLQALFSAQASQEL